MSDACISYRPGKFDCADGFIQTAACRGDHHCLLCRRPHESIPHCMREELPERWLTDEGKPTFYRPTLSREGRNG